MAAGKVQDRRQDILDAALAVLREHGYVGFTQPRVAARAGMRQSHLTYYFPTRADLLVAVAGAAAEAQLAVADALLEGSSPEAAASIARLVAQAENTRVLLALVCAATMCRACGRCSVRSLTAWSRRGGRCSLGWTPGMSLRLPTFCTPCRWSGGGHFCDRAVRWRGLDGLRARGCSHPAVR
jgi:AcrR family transcriptional regulator